jgi:phosphoenolpyruvate-protein kinase (PTS system EI component)
MSELLEYTYEEEKPDHLSEREALESYARAKREHPDALIVLRDLDCGHWQIKTYETDAEKNAFLSKRLSFMVRNFWSAFRLTPKTP